MGLEANNTGSNRGNNDTGLPSAAGRKEVAVSGTQGVAATGGLITKAGSAALGATPLPRDGAKKKAKVVALIPRAEMYAILYIGGNTGNDKIEPFSTENFLLQQVQMQSAERYQIVETFQKPLIYFMDKAPEIFQYSGTLINADLPEDAPEGSEAPRWRDQFITNWENRIRGTRCAETQTRVFLDYNGLLVSGYMLTYSMNENAEEPNKTNFTFALYVTNVKVFGG